MGYSKVEQKIQNVKYTLKTRYIENKRNKTLSESFRKEKNLCEAIMNDYVI